MNTFLYYCLLFVTVKAAPSPTDIYDKLIPLLIGETPQLSNITYDLYSIVFSHSYFMHPITANMTKVISEKEVIGKIIWMTLYFQNVYITLNETDNIVFYRHVIYEFEIKELTLILDEITNKVEMKNITITTPYTDKYWPFMTSSFFKEFQEDKGKKLTKEITVMLTSYISNILSHIDNN